MGTSWIEMYGGASLYWRRPLLEKKSRSGRRALADSTLSHFPRAVISRVSDYRKAKSPIDVRTWPTAGFHPRPQQTEWYDSDARHISL